MPRLTWGATGQRFYETGVDRGVLYVDTQPGVAWPGLISVPESPSGGDARAYYIDGIKYLNISSAEEFEATINAFASPAEFAPCDGTTAIHNGLFVTQQPRKSFGFSYRTMVGSDLDPDYGYKIHLVYNALAAPSQRSNNTINDSSEPDAFSWDISTRPPTFTGYKPTAHFVVESKATAPYRLAAFEDILYGNDTNLPRLPPAQELVDFFSNNDYPLLRAVWFAPNYYEFHEVDPEFARAVMQPTPPPTPAVGEDPIIWFDTSSGNYGIPKLVMGG